MSFVDWMHESRERVNEDPLHTAVRDSAAEFVGGAEEIVRWKLLNKLHDQGFATQTVLAGETIAWDVRSRVDIRRAEDGLREEPAIEWLLENVDEESVFWDVGAFHGTFTVIAGRREATVCAFEPHPDNRTRLHRNCQLNSVDVDLRAYALSDEERVATFSDPGRTAEFQIAEEGETKVRTRQGDNADGPQPDVLKVDVEGHELAVLDGMSDRLRCVERVLVEVHEGVAPDNVRDRLLNAGLQVREIDTPRTQTYLGGERQ